MWLTIVLITQKHQIWCTNLFKEDRPIADSDRTYYIFENIGSSVTAISDKRCSTSEHGLHIDQF